MNAERQRLPPNQQLIRTERWPIVGESGPRKNDDSPWTLTLSDGEKTKTYTLDELNGLTACELVCDIHCVTRWSKYDMRFTGIPLQQLLADLGPGTHEEQSIRFASFVARSDRNHSTSLPLKVALNHGAIIAMGYEGQPLPMEHGGPVRMVVPGRYFYKSVKWLDRINIVPQDSLGYWEVEAGYHNGADPWREQRYVAASISKQEAARLMETRDFSGQNLLGISGANRDLTGLCARRATLRNADFSGAQLVNADFFGANLANASFATARLRGASFASADLDGADFSSADLCGADLRAASMVGTSFGRVDENGNLFETATLDDQTKVDSTKLDGLTQPQREWLEGQR